MLSVELRRAFGSRSFLLAFAVGLAIVLFHVVVHVVPDANAYIAGWAATSHKGEYPLSLYQTWLGAGRPESQIFFLVLPLLAALPYGASLLEDRSSGYVTGIVTRAARVRYYAAKAAAVFLTAAVAVTLPLLIDFGLTALFFPALPPEATTGDFPLTAATWGGDLFVSHPLAYVFLSLGLLFLWAGLIGLTTVPLSYLVRNRILVVLVPFVVILFVEFLTHSLPGNAYQWSPLSFLSPSQPGQTGFSVIAGEWVALITVITLFLAWRARADETL
jgi:hypothetical protein